VFVLLGNKGPSVDKKSKHWSVIKHVCEGNHTNTRGTTLSINFKINYEATIITQQETKYTSWHSIKVPPHPPLLGHNLIPFSSVKTFRSSFRPGHGYLFCAQLISLASHANGLLHQNELASTRHIQLLNFLIQSLPIWTSGMNHVLVLHLPRPGAHIFWVKIVNHCDACSKSH
jgi:hypothetical protein